MSRKFGTGCHCETERYHNIDAPCLCNCHGPFPMCTCGHTSFQHDYEDNPSVCLFTNSCRCREFTDVLTGE